VVRDETGRIRAFHNVRRHRGSRICPAEEGHAKTLVCPYHAWTYGLDGRLKSARHLPAGLDCSALGLHEIAYHQRGQRKRVYRLVSPGTRQGLRLSTRRTIVDSSGGS